MGAKSNMITIHDIEVLIECKRLVEKMLSEKKRIMEYLEEAGKGEEQGARCTLAQIARMERALQGKPPVEFYDKFGREEVC